MTLSHLLDIAAAGMLGGGIALVGNVLSIYLGSIRKMSNGRSIAGQAMTILTAIAEIIRNRHNAQDEAESVAELFTGIQALLTTFRKGKDDPDLVPKVQVSQTANTLTTTVTTDTVKKSPETSDKITPEKSS